MISSKPVVPCSALAVLLIVSIAPSFAEAQNPSWPNRTATREGLADPANWPDDPGYGYAIRGAAPSRWTNSTGGQWNLWSWIPPETRSVVGYRQEEDALGAGMWADAAWQTTTGDGRVVIAILDSGIQWDEVDLTNQFYISRRELDVVGLDARCKPTLPSGHTGDTFDIDGDGVFAMRDYFAALDAGQAASLAAELDAAGNGNGVADPGDLIVLCSDGIDQDENGYIDDISGWDFFHDDNDPSDDTRFGHGTGEARLSVSETNNGIGRAGICPNCRALMVRAGDSFVVDTQDFAESVIFSVDSGARVIQEALGAINNTTFTRRALDYAYASNVLVVASAADENSRHHNYPGTNNHTLYVHAISYNGGNPQAAKSYLSFNNCTNYGGQLALSAPGTGCSSEATGVVAGIAGLVYSAAIDPARPTGPLTPPLHPEEARQVLAMTADDIFIPESDPAHPAFDADLYPSSRGWDQRFGYGRVNAHTSVRAIHEGRIPPRVDVTNPPWFSVVDPVRTPEVVIRGAISAPRAPRYDYVIEWAPGIEPLEGTYRQLNAATGKEDPTRGVLARFDVRGLVIDNPGEVENRHTITLRIRAYARYGDARGTIRGEQRRVISLHHDPDLLEGFPRVLGVRHDRDLHAGASGEGSPKLANLDADPALEIVYGDADGLLHVFDQDGSELPGYPVTAELLRTVDPAHAGNHLASRAYSDEHVFAGDVFASILATPAIGDLDGDGELEIVYASLQGVVHAVHARTGARVAGFPVSLPTVLSGDTLRRRTAGDRLFTSPKVQLGQGVFAAPALVDLDGDSRLEIVIPAFDGFLHVFRHDGTGQPGFPVRVHFAGLWPRAEDAEYGRIMTAPAIGDANGDGIPDIAVGSNEVGFDENSGGAHLIHGDGSLHEGGASHANWPARVDSLELFPLVGEGVVSPMAMADIDGDGVVEISLAGTGGLMMIAAGRQPARLPGENLTPAVAIDVGNRGRLSNVTETFDKPLLNIFASPSFGDLDGDGAPDFVTGGAGFKLAVNLAGGNVRVPFNHQVGAWDMARGKMLPGFPRIIEDYMFFVSPTHADLNGDAYPEAIVGSGGYYVHAWDACGREPNGWPKFVGGWVIASAAVGDVSGDGMMDVVSVTRGGDLFVFRTAGAATSAAPWPEYRHDNRNTGNFEAPLSNGAVRRTSTTPLVCEIPAAADAGVSEAGVTPLSPPTGGGCDCALVPGADRGDRSDVGGPCLAFAAVVVVGLRLRRRRRLA